MHWAAVHAAFPSSVVETSMNCCQQCAQQTDLNEAQTAGVAMSRTQLAFV
jgi:hypothetical protein